MLERIRGDDGETKRAGQKESRPLSARLQVSLVAAGVFLRIVAPLSANGLFAAAAFTFISTWSDFIVGLVLTTSDAAWPISVALAQSLNPTTEPS
jgi:ABC-type spermidine/putrescine transport system permease subunit I